MKKRVQSERAEDSQADPGSGNLQRLAIAGSQTNRAQEKGERAGEEPAFGVDVRIAEGSVGRIVKVARDPI